MSHLTRARRALARSGRVRSVAAFFATLVLIAVFAEVVAADAPIVSVGGGRVVVLAAVRHRARYAALSRDEIASLHRDDVALWPLVRTGPERREIPRAGPSLTHPLGTDGEGRDVFAGLVYGARAALAPSFFAVLLALTLGALLGGVAGVLGGMWDELLSRPIEVLHALPSISVVALALAIDPTRSNLTLVLAVAATRCAEIARVIRVDALAVTAEDHVLAARALGASPWRIMRRYVWPATAGPISVLAVATLPALVVLEASLAFLGLGGRASWGTMIAEAAAGGSAWAGGWAVATLFATVAALKLLADAAAEALDPYRGAPTRRRRAAVTPRGFS